MAAQDVRILIARRRVEQITGLARSTIYDRLANPGSDFPRPIRLAGCAAVRWLQDEVVDWVQRQIDASRQPAVGTAQQPIPGKTGKAKSRRREV